MPFKIGPDPIELVTHKCPYCHGYGDIVTSHSSTCYICGGSERLSQEVFDKYNEEQHKRVSNSCD